MAWQYPTHSCGHEGERYQAYGPNVDRRAKLAALESHPCPACRAKAALEQAQLAGLPELTGSDKQIAWASDIRSKAQKYLSAESFARISGETAAKFWIDHRDDISRATSLALSRGV